MHLDLVEDGIYLGISKTNTVKILIYALIQKREKQGIISFVFVGTPVNKQSLSGTTEYIGSK